MRAGCCASRTAPPAISGSLPVKFATLAVKRVFLVRASVVQPVSRQMFDAPRITLMLPKNPGADIMNLLQKTVLCGFATAFSLCGLASTANAADVSRLGGANPRSPIAEAVTVPPGYTTYYISGTPASPVDPSLPRTDPKRMGDTPAQTDSSLANLKKTLAQLGLTFGDVVKATVFMAGDPAKGGDLDFAGMNQEWSKQFGTPEQPNKPARSTIKVAGLATPGGLVEIEMVAIKKLP
jgi:enamine deaminase RidA (YjgF/YER057c/UK114 family)